MGSFPNMVASQLLKAIFVTPFSSGAVATASGSVCSLYNSQANTAGAGFFTSISTAIAQPLYLGLIEHSNVTPNGTITGTSLNDLIMQSTIGTVTSAAAWSPTAAGSGSSAELNAAGYVRVAFGATLTAGTLLDSGSTAAVTLPNAIANFAPSAGGITGYTTGTKGIVGFFISSFSAVGTGTDSARPHVIAYGVLSSARTLQNGDQPTFAAGAITITLD